MYYFVRKFTIAKWGDIADKDNVVLDLISSGAYTSCLRTKDNKLSIWKICCNIENEEELTNELEKIALAMVTSFDEIRNIDFIYFSENDINKLKKEKSEGNTPIKDLSDKHEDLEAKTLKDLKYIANVYINSIRNKQIRRFNKGQVKKIVDDAINNKLLTRENSRLITNMGIIEKLGLIEYCNECGNKVDLRKPKK